MSPEDWTGRRVLVTGAVGFIGSTLARWLVDAGADVTALDSFRVNSGANPFNLDGYAERLKLIRADIGDAAALRIALRDQEVLFNLAGATSHSESMTDPRSDLAINAAAQIEIVETCCATAPDIRVVYASTRQVYGRPVYQPVDEQHPLSPPDVNAINKIAGESYHRLYTKVYGLRANVLRLTNTYGPRMRVRDGRQMFLGDWILRALRGEEFEVWGGEQIRTIAYVDDVCRALLAAAHLPIFGHVFNVGGGTTASLLDLANRLVRHCGEARFRITEFPADRKAIDIGDFDVDDSAFRSATGWTPKVGCDQGFARTVGFYREHGRHYF